MLVNPFVRPIQAIMTIWSMLPISILRFTYLALFLLLVPMIYHLIKGVKG